HHPDTAPARKQSTQATWAGALICIAIIPAYPLVMWLIERHFRPQVGLFDVFSPDILGIMVAGSGVLVLLMFMPSTWTYHTKQALPFSRKRDFSSVTATSEGITWQPPRGRAHTLRWEDARLLEFRPNPRAGAFAYEYILYGQRDAVKWPVHLLTAVTSLFIDSVSQDDITRQQALLTLVRARTSLVPHTFVRPFQHAPGEAGQQALGRTTGWLAAACVALGALTVAVMAFPIVTIVWWNVLIAGSLAVGALVCLLVWRRMRRMHSWEISDAVPYTLPPDVAAIPSSEVLVLDTAYSRFGKVISLAITVVLGLAGLLALGAMIANFASLTNPSWAAISPDSSLPLICLVVVAGFVGVLAGISSVAVSRSSLRADAQGLSQQVRLYRVQTRWSEITELHVYARARKVVLYGVRRAPGEPVISWSRVRVRPRRVPSGATVITPEQLAVLVASRTNAPVLLHELPR
ncbi:MAG TPA: hypothetical protein VFY89_04800, partial [Ktedonobacterales bacterium]